MNTTDNDTMTRRDFAKISTAGIALLASTSAFGDKKKPKLKAGLLGCGGRGAGAASQILLGNENVDLVALADVFDDRLQGAKNSLKSHSSEKVRNQFKVKDSHCFVGLDAYKKILETDIDILLEGTLPYSRSFHIEAAINAGKHVFTEKPVAVDPVGIRRVIAASKVAREKKLSIVAGTQRRHQKPYVETIKKIHDGAIGEILAGKIYWCGGTPFIKDRVSTWSDLEYRIRNWINYCWVGGSNIVEQHVHNLDVMCWVMNDHPKSVFASGGRAWKPIGEKYGDIFDNFSCDYEFANGVHVASYSRWWDKCDGDVSEYFVGTKGKSKCHDMCDEKGIDPYVQEHMNLVDSVCGTGPYLNEGEQVAHSTLAAIMGRESAYTGKTVMWDEFLNSDLSIVPTDLDFSKSYPVPPIPIPSEPRVVA